MSAATAVLAACLLGGVAFGQDSEHSGNEDHVQTLFRPGTGITGFGSMDTRFTRLRGEEALLLGIKGGIIFDGRLFVGLSGHGMVTPNRFTGQTSSPGGIQVDRNLSLKFGYGGVELGYALAPVKVVHIYIPVLFGAGMGEVVHKFDDQVDFNSVPYSEAVVDNSIFLVVEPGLQVEVNILPYMKFGFGGSYRQVFGANLAFGIDDPSLSGWAGSFTVTWGVFR
jgi:hypothetical protein